MKKPSAEAAEDMLTCFQKHAFQIERFAHGWSGSTPTPTPPHHSEGPEPYDEEEATRDRNKAAWFAKNKDLLPPE
eukprot:12274449-Alexandrium_andersonii.AAC.1